CGYEPAELGDRHRVRLHPEPIDLDPADRALFRIEAVRTHQEAAVGRVRSRAGRGACECLAAGPGADHIMVLGHGCLLLLSPCGPGSVAASPIERESGRVGAAAAIGAPPVCLEWSTTRALAAGAGDDEIAEVLLAIAPVAGLGRVVSAAPQVAA